MEVSSLLLCSLVVQDAFGETWLACALSAAELLEADLYCDGDRLASCQNLHRRRYASAGEVE